MYAFLFIEFIILIYLNFFIICFFLCWSSYVLNNTKHIFYTYVIFYYLFVELLYFKNLFTKISFMCNLDKRNFIFKLNSSFNSITKPNELSLFYFSKKSIQGPCKIFSLGPPSC